MVLCRCSLPPVSAWQRWALAGVAPSGPEPTQGLLVWGVGAGSPVPKPALQVLPSCAQRPDLHGLGLCTVPGSQGLRAEEGALRLKLGHCHFRTRHKSVGPG